MLDPSTPLAFRQFVRTWLAENCPPELPEVGVEQIMFQDFRGMQAWADAIHAAGLMCICWPEEYGGQGRTAHDLAALTEEFAFAGVPRPTRGLGESLVGPALLQWGTEAQKLTFLPRIVDGTDRYCQGFSEPSAGSDLAGLSTRGVVEADEVVITGQKVWTSAALAANMMFCLCRTDEGSQGRRGLSYVLVPIRRADGSANGIDVRPIRQPTGSAEFAEAFIDGARAPLSNVIGGLGNGWKVAQTTLGSERSASSTHHLPFRHQFWRAVALLREAGNTGDPRVRQELARAYSRIEIMRFAGALSAAVDAGDRAWTEKLFWTEHHAGFASVLTRLRGAHAMVMAASPSAAEPDYSPDEWTRNFLFAPGFRIAGGTNEVMRNLVAERALGLPREPAPPTIAPTREDR